MDVKCYNSGGGGVSINVILSVTELSKLIQRKSIQILSASVKPQNAENQECQRNTERAWPAPCQYFVCSYDQASSRRINL